MKKNLLAFLFILAASSLMAQLSFDKSEVIVNEPDQSKAEVVGYAHLKNKSGSQLMVSWEAKVTKFQQGWEDYYCMGVCFDKGARKGSIELYFLVDNQEELSAHMIPNNLIGVSEIEFTATEVGNPNNSATTKFIFNIGQTATNNLAADVANWKVFPNPTTETFQVTNTNAARRVDIYNLLGRKVKSFNYELNKFFDVEELSQGLYLVRVVGDNNKILKTMRLNKKNP